MPATTRREEIIAGRTRMTALVKGSVARGHASPPPEAHMIKYARGGSRTQYRALCCLPSYLDARLER